MSRGKFEGFTFFGLNNLYKVGSKSTDKRALLAGNRKQVFEEELLEIKGQN